MTSEARERCEHTDLVCLYAMDALPTSEAPALEAHLSTCPECRQELETLRPIVDSFAHWPSDVLRPSASLWGRLAQRIATETGGEPLLAEERRWSEPDWQRVAPGISCKLFATDAVRERVSMLVRLEAGAHYPPHTHAGVEELHLLHGELWIGERKLHPGDYNRSEPGSSDQRVWSETGCTCVLVTSTRDVLA
jgi:anti-sigma factor ChrR (cupin superfamily)